MASTRISTGKLREAWHLLDDVLAQVEMSLDPKYMAARSDLIAAQTSLVLAIRNLERAG